jgi:NADPH-dependent 2,4-dienoyl-CoA reductase/sulfur reductase-like enzyme
VSEHADVLIVGAGLAGARCAESLRAGGAGGRIVLIGGEPHAPYERPALSKELLTGARDARDLALRPDTFWAAHDVDLRLDTRVESLDLYRRRAVAGGTQIGFRRLVLATGLRPRKLPGLDGDGVHYLRTLDDAGRLRSALTPGTRLVVVGAGFVGLEVASSAHALGIAVTVVEPYATPLSRPLGERVGARLARWVREAGVDLRLGTAVAGLEREAGRLRAARLRDGTRVVCDHVVVGVGAQPNAELVVGELELAADGGIPTDAAGRTAIDGVYACGDVASVRRPEGALRLEHWTAAAATARAVAAAILGRPAAAPDTPFFWSDQFGRRLQAIGLPSDGLEVELSDHDDGFAARYRDADGRLRGAVVVDRPDLLGALRREVVGAPARAADAQAELREGRRRAVASR